ncbi:YHS domain-containing protein [filamentous cyanobacterium CCP1]|nr:YHS domain-containing protein [filamentous cyanobacterium CCP2]PSB68058.1 YHS domain-containing protein [filamentous cyanobacterium CCP1]
MNTKHFAIFAITSILGLSLAAGCTAPGTGNTTESTTEEGAIETYPEPPTEASPTEASPTEESLAEPEATAPQDASLVFYSDNGFAIRGTDPVAYFQQGQPVQGSEAFSYEWGNATWLFSSAENRDLFASDPERYAPEYGGFCAWAVSQGYTAPIDPNAWKIVGDRLYLNATTGVQRRWERDIPGNIAKADQNWPGIQGDLIQ